MRPQTDPSPPAGRSERAWIAPGLVAAGALLLLRTEVIAELARGERAVEPAVAAWAAAGRAPQTVVHALVLGLAAAAVAWFGGSRGGWRLPAAFALAASILYSALSGWPVAPATELARSPTAAGLASTWVLLGIACAAGALLVVAGRTLGGSGLARVLGSSGVLAAAALVGFGAPLGLVLLRAADAPTMPLREVARVLVPPKAWTVLREDPEHPPRAAVISPIVDFRYDSGDKPSLVMPPPCELERTIAPEEDGTLLFAAAGIDIATRRGPAVSGEPLRVRFEVELDGEKVLDRTVELRSEDALRAAGRLEECAWIHAGGGDGIRVAAGQRLRLRTSLPDHEGADPAALPPAARGLVAGFGGLTLERWREVRRTRATPERPNVVLIVMDTLRADRMSCYGYEKPTTPHVDALAARGILFEEAYATSSWTWPSTASILTGLLPDEHGVVSNESCTLHLDYETLAEALQRRGFSTAAITCNPLIAAERYFDQGFETFDGALRMRKTDEVIEDVLATLERLADRRFFLYLHFVDPHTPHQPLATELERLGGTEPDDYPTVEREGRVFDGMDVYTGKLMRGEGVDEHGELDPSLVIPADHVRWMNDAYDACVGTGDHYCGLVLDALERLGLAENTVVAFTSDHGEELLDHGLLAHGHTLHRELVRVPLVLAGPGLPRGVRVSTRVSNRHLAPTLALVGGAAMERIADPLSLVAAEPPEQPVFYQTEKGYWNGHKGLSLHGLRDGGYVLHRAPLGADRDAQPGPPGQARLYRFEDDPLELVDLLANPEYRDEAQSMAQRADAILAAQREARRGEALGTGAGAIDMLIGVGYLDSDEPDDDRDDGAER